MSGESVEAALGSEHGEIEGPFDYVIVGSGPSGCALARSLLDHTHTAESAPLSIAILEQGPDPSIDCTHAAGSPFCVTQDQCFRPHSAHAYPFHDCLWSGSAQVVGGGSAVNAGFMVDDNAYWGDMERGWFSGCPHIDDARRCWGLQDVERSRCEVMEALGMNPRGTPLDVKRRSVLGDTFVEECIGKGYALGDAPYALCELQSCGRGDVPVAGFTTNTMDSGRRRMAQDMLMETPGGNLRPGVRIFPSTCVHRVCFSASSPRTAVGVETSRGVVRARHEVVLCAGPEPTVRLLYNSGVGPRTVLDEAGLRVAHDVADIGNHVYDHPTAFEPVFVPKPLWKFRLRGKADTSDPLLPFTLPKYEAAAFNRNHGFELSLVSSQGFMVSAKSLAESPARTVAMVVKVALRVLFWVAWALGWQSGREPLCFGAIFVTCLRPRTRAAFRPLSSSSSSTTAPPQRHFHCLRTVREPLHAEDRAVLARGLAQAADVVSRLHARHRPSGGAMEVFCRLVDWALRCVGLASGAATTVGGSGGDGATSGGAEAAAPRSPPHVALVRNVGTLWHPMGGASFGRVLDHRLAVVGLRGLRVCGAAAFPAPVPCNPMLPCYTMGWHLGRLIAATPAESGEGE